MRFADLQSGCASLAAGWQSQIFCFDGSRPLRPCLVDKLRQLSASGGSQRRDRGFGCQCPTATEVAVSGFRIACGGNLAAVRSSPVGR